MASAETIEIGQFAPQLAALRAAITGLLETYNQDEDETADMLRNFAATDVEEALADAWREYATKHRLVGACRVCGCTDSYACDGGCTWVEPDLCSACAEQDGDQ